MIDIDAIPKLPGVYKFTNKVNGKVYIGKSVTLKKRVADYKNGEFLPLPRSPGKFLYAIKKYGFNNFSFEILELHKERNWFTEQFIVDQEEMWIEYYNSTDRNIGYNSYSNATGQISSFISKETREKMGKDRVGKYRGKESPHWGKTCKNKKKGNTNHLAHNRKKVQQIDPKTGSIIRTFYSLKDVSTFLSRSYRTVRENIPLSIKRNGTYLGYKWSYNISKVTTKKFRLIHKLDLNTEEVISTHLSLTEAAKTIGARANSISNSIKRNGTCGGFLWKGEF